MSAVNELKFPSALDADSSRDMHVHTSGGVVVCLCLRACVSVSVCLDAFVFVCLCGCVFVCLCVCVFVCVRVVEWSCARVLCAVLLVVSVCQSRRRRHDAKSSNYLRGRSSEILRKGTGGLGGTA